MGKKNAHKVSLSKPERKPPLGRSRHRWEKSITMDLQKIGWEGADCIYLVQDTKLAVSNEQICELLDSVK
jgi:hypothetical protein